MSVAPTSTARDNDPPSLLVRIYVDNSNVYIQGGKATSSGSHQAPVTDTTWRYDIGKLREVLCDNSIHSSDAFASCTTVYGSVPPPEGFWTAMESHYVNIEKLDRSTITGKEKQVDTTMVADITEHAVEDNHKGTRSEFIIVTGDADLLPAVKRVIGRGYRVHIWSWRSSFAKAYRDLVSNNNGLCSLYYLDNHKSQFEFHRWCNYGKYCRDYRTCRLHSGDDQEFFRQNGNKQPWRYWPCRFGDSCRNGQNCSFFHDEAERVCLTCDLVGQGHGEVGSPEWQAAHGST